MGAAAGVCSLDVVVPSLVDLVVPILVDLELLMPDLLLRQQLYVKHNTQ